MTNRETQAETPMGKVSKSLMLNEDILRVVDAHQAGTGATFTRVITAAVLQYLFDRPGGPDAYWMRVAMAVEKGNCAVGDIPLKLAEGRIQEATQQRESYKRAGMSPDEFPMQERGAALSEATRAKQHWEWLTQHAPTPLDAVICQLDKTRPFGLPDQPSVQDEQ